MPNTLLRILLSQMIRRLVLRWNVVFPSPGCDRNEPRRARLELEKVTVPGRS